MMDPKNKDTDTNNLYFQATSVDNAISIASYHINNFQYLAGGTDLIVNKFNGNATSNCLIDISEIDELNQIYVRENYLHIGAMVNLDNLKNNKIITDCFPTLLNAAHAVATPVIRKTATIGGNVLCENRCIFYNQSAFWRESVGYCLKCEGDICIATGGKKACFSKFVSDTAPVLICCDAQVEVVDMDGLKIFKLEDIYTGDGINPKYLSKTAILKSIFLPLTNTYKVVFNKLRPRESVDYSSLTSAVSKDRFGRIKIALGGVDPKPVVVEGASLALKDELLSKAIKQSRIIDNDFYSRSYRKEMISVFLNRSFEILK